MRNIDSINFRYRGPSESRKNNKVMHDTIDLLNDIINEMNILLNSTSDLSNEIMYNVRRRGYYYGTTESEDT